MTSQPRKNARRFFRVDMPMHILVTSSVPLPNAEIYAIGIDYFTPKISALIEKQLSDTNSWADKIQEQKEILQPLSEEIIESIQILGQGTKRLSNGENPKKDISFWLLVEKKKLGFENLNDLKKIAPKTYAYFKLIEDKFLYYLNCFIENVTDSNLEIFADNSNLSQQEFKIDKLIKGFSNPNYDKIPLVQSIIALSNLMDTHLSIFRELNNDFSIRKRPQNWPLEKVNISASGVSLSMAKRFRNKGRLNIFIYFPDDKKILKFDGSIANIFNIDSPTKEKTAINFDFPDGKSQQILVFKIQEYELKRCETQTF